MSGVVPPGDIPTGIAAEIVRHIFNLIQKDNRGGIKGIASMPSLFNYHNDQSIDTSSILLCTARRDGSFSSRL